MDFQLPELGEGIYEAELIEWLVKPGDNVSHGQPLAQVMTDKATMELPSPFTGCIDRLCAEPGDQMTIGQVILVVAQAAQPPSPDEPTTEIDTGNGKTDGQTRPAGTTSASAAATAESPKSGVKAAPAIRQLAQRLDIDLEKVAGSGPDGRILLDDFAQNVSNSRWRDTSETHQLARPTADPLLPGVRIPLRGLRRKIAEHMVHAKQTIPHYSLVNECDVTDLVRIRSTLKDSFAESGIKLTYLPFFLKAVVSALKQVPLVNASLDEEAEEIVLHDRWDIGIATDVPDGLVVPVIRSADSKDIKELAIEIQRLTSAARSGQLAPNQLCGSTFTITSLGAGGGLISTPVINHPEVGILSIGRITRRPALNDLGQVCTADLVHLSYSFDHRVVDGAVAASFSNEVVKCLESPATLLF